MADLATR